ncbi:MAG TPA: hypothetical protein EYG03_11995 [Planctomycetes bacterium]|nr:hypothetical protein [Planctomycetota bacterium]
MSEQSFSVDQEKGVKYQKCKATFGLFGIAGMAVVFTIGCSDLSTPQPIPTDTSTTELHGRQTLTIHVPQMSERLKLL